MLNFREEVIQSTFKIRQARFADCIDARQGFNQTAQYADRPQIKAVEEKQCRRK
jgi:hypothetical protein